MARLTRSQVETFRAILRNMERARENMRGHSCYGAEALDTAIQDLAHYLVTHGG